MRTTFLKGFAAVLAIALASVSSAQKSMQRGEADQRYARIVTLKTGGGIGDVTTAKLNASNATSAAVNSSATSSVITPPIYDNSVSTSTAGASSVTTSVNTFGFNRCVVEFVSYSNASSPVSTVTCGGTAMTLLSGASATGTNGLGVYYLLSPTAGTNSVVTTNSNSSVAEAITVVSVSGVAAIGASIVATGSGTTASLSLTTASTSVVLDAVSSFNGTVTSGSSNVPSGPTATAPRYATQQQITQSTVQDSAETLTGGSNPTWTVPNGAWTVGAVELVGSTFQGASGGTTGPAKVLLNGPPGDYYLALPSANTYAAIELPFLSNVKIEVAPGVRLHLANGADCYMLLAFGCANITVDGGYWDANIDNNSATGNWNGSAGANWNGCHRWFDNCTNCGITNSYIYGDPSQANYGGFGLWFTFCKAPYVVHNRFDINKDGFHWGPGNSELVAKDNSGYTGDNFTCFAAMDYPSVDVRGGGNNTGGIVDGLHCEGNVFSPARIVGGENTFGAYGITIRNIDGYLASGANGFEILEDGTHTQTTGTVCDGIVVDGFNISSQWTSSSVAVPFFLAATHMHNITLRNAYISNFSTSASAYPVYLDVSGTTIDNLTIDGFVVPASSAFAGYLFYQQSSTTVGYDVNILNCKVYGSTNGGSLVFVNNGATLAGKLNILDTLLYGNAGSSPSSWFVNINAGALISRCNIGHCNANTCRGFLSAGQNSGTFYATITGTTTPATYWAFNINTGIFTADASGCDFSGITNAVIRNASSSGSPHVRIKACEVPSSSTLHFVRTSTQTNMGVDSELIQVNGTYLTPVQGDYFWNTNGSYGSGTGLYFYGTSAHLIGAWVWGNTYTLLGGQDQHVAGSMWDMNAFAF